MSDPTTIFSLSSEYNIIELKKNRAVAAAGPFKLLYKYERTLLEHSQRVRALQILGSGAAYATASAPILGSPTISWFKIAASANLNFSFVPDTFFDFIELTSVPIPDAFAHLQQFWRILKNNGKVNIGSLAAILAHCNLTIDAIPLLLATLKLTQFTPKISGKFLILIKNPFTLKNADAVASIFKSISVPAVPPAAVPVTEAPPATATTLEPIRVPIVLINGFANKNSSCFMDSILVPNLLASRYFERHILAATATTLLQKSVQEMLIKMRNNFNNVGSAAAAAATCQPLTKILRKAGASMTDLLSGNIQDDSEFLYAFMEIFQLNPIQLQLERSVSTDGQNWTISSKNLSNQAIIEITFGDSPINLLDFQEPHVTDYSEEQAENWPEYQGKRFQFGAEQMSIQGNPEQIIFHLTRKIVGKKLLTPVHIDEYIVAQGPAHQAHQKIYSATIITIHHLLHYTAFFKYKGAWFYYNDLRDSGARITPVQWSSVQKIASTRASLIVYE